MALRPTDLAVIACGTALFAGFMLMVDRVIAGVVQCSTLGCLPQ